MPKWLKLVEWGGCITGLAGSFILALNISISGIGFVLFLLSNACWITYGIKTRAKGLLFMQLGFTTTSVTGIYQWLF